MVNHNLEFTEEWVFIHFFNSGKKSLRQIFFLVTQIIEFCNKLFLVQIHESKLQKVVE